MVREYTVLGFIVVYLSAMDLILNRKQEMTLGRATSWSLMYILIAMAFAAWLWAGRGPIDAQLFLTAYVLEKALSVDNLMVFSAVFSYFGIRSQHRHRILRWGIVGAAVMRLIFVYAGTGMFMLAEGIMSTIFAGLILIAALTMLRGAEEEPVDHGSRWYTRWLRSWLPLFTGHAGEGKFLVRCHNTCYEPPRGYWAMTPALLCLVSIEVTDLIFAVDSVPVVIAVARDPFIVYSAMIFAIMGLRALYFVLEALQSMLRFMNIAVSIVLMFVAAKLMAGVFGWHIPPMASLTVVMTILAAGVLTSLMVPKGHRGSM